MNKVTEIFCSIDDFCLEFVPNYENHLLSNTNKRNKVFKLTLSEVMTIQVLFHISGFRNFKTFYKGYVCAHLNTWFPDLVSYNRQRRHSALGYKTIEEFEKINSNFKNAA